MAFTKFIIPALALTSTAFAQSKDICDGPSITIASSADAAQIADCEVYKGDVTIDESASGTIQINGVQQISGDLLCNNATQLTAITSDQLNEIGGAFSLTGLTILSTLSFDSLSAIKQINWVGLPALQSLNFAQTVDKATTVLISNTQLNNIEGIDLTAVSSLDINNNPYLTSVNVNSLKNVTTAISFSANGRDLEILFPNLENAANLTFRNVSRVDMPSLATVAGSIGFYSDSFESFSAPNLTLTGGTLAFVDSPNLAALSFPSLTTIGGGFLIANNTALAAIDGFPKLKTIVGALDFAGTFDYVKLNALTEVRGGSNVQTTSTNTTICDLFNKAHANGVIRGVNTCITGKANPESNPTSTGGGSSSSPSSTSAPGAGNALTPALSMTGLVGAVAALLFI